jgi:hypothetical protein
MVEPGLAMLAFLDGQRCADQPHVHVRLWKIPERCPTLWIDFFGKEAQIVRIRKQPFE